MTVLLKFGSATRINFCFSGNYDLVDILQVSCIFGINYNYYTRLIYSQDPEKYDMTSALIRTKAEKIEKKSIVYSLVKVSGKLGTFAQTRVLISFEVQNELKQLEKYCKK